MVYSNIAAIDIKDFRCLEKLHLDFKDSPIICIQAGNDSGKSSAVKAIETIMYNDNERKNKGYIRTGTNGFEISVTLDDGRIIQRVKGSAGNIYRIINADGSLANEWTKLENNVPQPVQDIFGLVEDESTGELLNIRTCESLLLFALTKPSENHKIFYSQLKVDEISSAMNIGKEAINKFTSDISASTKTVESYQAKLKTIRIPEMSGVEQLKERIDATAKSLHDASDAISTKRYVDSTKQQLGVLAELNNVQPISDSDISTLASLENIRLAINNANMVRSLLSKISDAANLEEIPFEQMELLLKLGQAITTLNTIRELRNSDAGTVATTLDSVSALDDSMLNDVIATVNTLNSVRQLRQQYSDAYTELEKLRTELNDSIKQLGMYVDSSDDSLVMKCAHCGEENRLQLSLIEKACSEVIA